MPEIKSVRQRYAAVIASSATRDVQFCRTDDTDPLSPDWEDLEGAEIFLGLFDGADRNAVLTEAARYGRTVENNIRLVPVANGPGPAARSGPAPVPVDPADRKPGEKCWAVFADAYGKTPPEQWPGLAPMRGTLQSDYYQHSRSGGDPVAFFLPDEMPSGEDPCNYRWHVSNLVLASSEQDAKAMLADQARAGLDALMRRADALRSLMAAGN